MNNAWQASGNPPVTTPAGLREDRILQALKFLSDPRTRSASQQDKERFLRQKGLTENEIEASFSRANSASTSSQSLSFNDPAPAFRPVYLPPQTVDEPIIWAAIKSIFSAVGAMAIGVLGYHQYLDVNRMKENEHGTCDNSNNFLGEDRCASTSAFITEDQLNEVLKTIKAEQEIKHKELMLSIRELSSSIVPTRLYERKPGGSVVVEKNDVLLVAQSQEGILTDPLDIPTEVSKLVQGGLESIVKLIFATYPPHKKLNKSNIKFKKLEGSLLLRHCGYVETNEFFEFHATDTSLQERITDVLNEFENQASAERKSKSADNDHSNEQCSLHAPTTRPMNPPWLLQSPAPLPKPDSPLARLESPLRSDVTEQ